MNWPCCVVGGFDYNPGGLAKPEGRISEKVVDGQKLGEGSGVRIGRLTGENCIAQSLMVAVHDLLEERFVESMRRAVQT